MVLAGVAVLMTIHDMSKREKLVWLFLVFALMFLENKSIDKDRSDASARDKTLIESANTLVSQVSLMVPQVTQANKYLGELRGQLQDSLKDNDKKRSAELRRQIAIAQKQADDASLRLMLTTAPIVLADLRSWSDKWEQSDRQIDIEWSQVRHSQNIQNISKNEWDRLKAPFDTRRAIMNTTYSSEVTPLLASANYLRGEILRRFPNYSQPTEPQISLIFEKAVAGSPLNWKEMRDIYYDMYELLRNFPSTKLS